jgi:hypothetical protein
MISFRSIGQSGLEPTAAAGAEDPPRRVSEGSSARASRM